MTARPLVLHDHAHGNGFGLKVCEMPDLRGITFRVWQRRTLASRSTPWA